MNLRVEHTLRRRVLECMAEAHEPLESTALGLMLAVTVQSVRNMLYELVRSRLVHSVRSPKSRGRPARYEISPAGRKALTDPAFGLRQRIVRRKHDPLVALRARYAISHEKHLARQRAMGVPEELLGLPDLFASGGSRT